MVQNIFRFFQRINFANVSQKHITKIGQSFFSTLKHQLRAYSDMTRNSSSGMGQQEHKTRWKIEWILPLWLYQANPQWLCQAPIYYSRLNSAGRGWPLCVLQEKKKKKKKRRGGREGGMPSLFLQPNILLVLKKIKKKKRYDAIDLLHIEVQQNTIMHFRFGGQLLSCMLVENLSKIHILQET